MGNAQPLVHRFNEGEISKSSLGRVDVERIRLAAEVQENVIPAVIGRGQFRGGTKYLSDVYENKTFKYIPFVKSVDDTALLEVTNNNLRVMLDGEFLSRTYVDSQVVSGEFDSSTGWTLATGTGGSATISSGYLSLQAEPVGSYASCSQQLTTNDPGREHGLRIKISRGPVTFSCGATEGGGDYIGEVELDEGEYSFAFTPLSSYWLYFYSELDRDVRVERCVIESNETVALTVPWTEQYLRNIKYVQSVGTDAVFATDGMSRQYRVLRYGERSWGVAAYLPDDGPFTVARTSNLVLTNSVLSGNGTLTASRNFFSPSHVGALFKLTHKGERVSNDLVDGDAYTGVIRVAGTGTNNRSFILNIAGTWSGTVTLERSFDGPATGFAKHTSYTSNQSAISIDDGLTEVAWYRLGFVDGAYSSGTAEVYLDYPGGGFSGICRVTAFSSQTEVGVEILTPFSKVGATDFWVEGQWSDRRGWPEAVTFADGRMTWGKADAHSMSVSDAYTSFDTNVEGDSGPILRNLPVGGGIKWYLPLLKLIAGTASSEVSISSSNFDEPLTPTKFLPRDISTYGVSGVAPVKVDTSGVFVDRTETRAYLLEYNAKTYNYGAVDLTRLNDEILNGDIVSMAVQRQPDPRIWFVRGDGVAVCLLLNRDEDVQCWYKIVTEGVIEDVAVLPESGQDAVYLGVKRNINGADVRYHEKLAPESLAIGGTTNLMADAYLYNTGPVQEVTGLDHLEGKQVIAWGNSRDLGQYTVSSGSITLTEEATGVCVGLGYDGRWKSAKLSYASDDGTALLQHKKVGQIGLLLLNTYHDAISYGPDFDNLDPMPMIEGGAPVEDGTLHSVYDEPLFTFDGDYDTDSRICIKMTAPKPATLLGLVIDMKTNDK